jgi:hypothetical protein
LAPVHLALSAIRFQALGSRSKQTHETSLQADYDNDD